MTHMARFIKIYHHHHHHHHHQVGLTASDNFSLTLSLSLSLQFTTAGRSSKLHLVVLHRVDVCSCRQANTGMSMFRAPWKSVAYVFVLASLAVSYMSSSSYLNDCNEMYIYIYIYIYNWFNNRDILWLYIFVFPHRFYHTQWELLNKPSMINWFSYI